MSTAPLDPARLLAEARAAGAVHTAALCVVRDGVTLLAEGPVEALFDVASVTKVATAIATLQQLPVDHRVNGLRGAPTIAQLLSHSAGLPAWRPLFALAARALSLTPSLLAARACGKEADAELAHAVQAIYQRLIAETEPVAPRPTYSDLGFLALGMELASITRQPLSTRIERLFDAGDAVLGPPRDRDAIATGIGRPRAGNPAVETGLIETAGIDASALDRGPDDDNAACAGGLCGHAGLFTSARALALLGDRLRRDADEGTGALLPQPLAQRMFERVCGSRTLGLDTPDGDRPSIGTQLGRGPRGAAGHLGFTGCSLWIDRDARLSIALLTDAVACERPALAWRAVRPRVHDAVAHTLGVL